MDKNNHQIIFNNPDGTVELGTKEFKVDSFLNKFISPDDINVLKKAKSNTRNKIIEKLDENKSIKILMKEIFKR